MKLMTRVAYALLAALAALALPSTVSAQESKSGPLAKQLSAALDAGKLDSIAAQDPSDSDRFVAALYFPGVQLLIISEKNTVTCTWI